MNTIAEALSFYVARAIGTRLDQGFHTQSRWTRFESTIDGARLAIRPFTRPSATHYEVGIDWLIVALFRYRLRVEVLASVAVERGGWKVESGRPGFDS